MFHTFLEAAACGEVCQILRGKRAVSEQRGKGDITNFHLFCCEGSACFLWSHIDFHPGLCSVSPCNSGCAKLHCQESPFQSFCYRSVVRNVYLITIIPYLCEKTKWNCHLKNLKHNVFTFVVICFTSVSNETLCASFNYLPIYLIFVGQVIVEILTINPSEIFASFSGESCPL